LTAFSQLSKSDFAFPGATTSQMLAVFGSYGIRKNMNGALEGGSMSFASPPNIQEKAGIR